LFLKYYKGTDHHGKIRNMDLGTFATECAAQKDIWIESKFLGAELCWYLTNMKPKDADRLTGAIIQYAASESEMSAPYIKVM